MYKKHFVTFVKPRKDDLAKRPLPKAQEGPRAPGKVKIEKSQYPSLVMSQWQEEKVEQLVACLEADFDHLSLQELASTDKPEEVRELRATVCARAPYFFALHRSLLCASDQYPRVSYEEILDLFTACKIIKKVNKKEKEEDNVNFLTPKELEALVVKALEGHEKAKDRKPLTKE